MGPDIHDFDVFALLLEQESDIDPPQIVAVNRERPIEVVVEILIIEVAQGVNILDFLDGKNVGLRVEDGQRGIIALPNVRLFWGYTVTSPSRSRAGRPIRRLRKTPTV